MKFSPNLAVDHAAVLSASEDGIWQPDAELGSLRVEIVERTTFSMAFPDSAGQMAATRLSIARCHPSSLVRPGRFLRARGRLYRIEAVIEEREGFLRYQSMTLKEVQ